MKWQLLVVLVGLARKGRARRLQVQSVERQAHEESQDVESKALRAAVRAPEALALLLVGLSPACGFAATRPVARFRVASPVNPDGHASSGRLGARMSSTQEAATTETEKSDGKSNEPFIRIGHGYDIHRLAPREEAGQPIVIGGVTFDGSTAPDNELGCVAHSDGDIVYHSVVDAILGALTMPDIGQLFPDNDPKLKGSDSSIFMEEAYTRMRSRGYSIGNVDVTIICQTPRINVVHAGKACKTLMVDNMARLLHTSHGRLNVKARTHEKVDSVGEKRAMECHVVLTLEKDM